LALSYVSKDDFTHFLPVCLKACGMNAMLGTMHSLVEVVILAILLFNSSTWSWQFAENPNINALYNDDALLQPQFCITLSQVKRVKLTTLSISAIKFACLTRFTPLLLLQIQCCMWRNHRATLLPPFTSSNNLQWGIPATNMLGAVCCSHNAALT